MPANVVIRIGAQTSQAVSEINKVNSALGDQMSTGSKAQLAIKKAAVPATFALVALGAAAVDAGKAAAEDAAAQAKLVGQLDRVTDATDKQLSGVDAWISKMSLATGTADDELRPALGKLASATHDLGSAQNELQIALDISAQTGKSLDTVTTALAKGYTGQTSAINKLVPGLDQAVIKSKDMVAINKELADSTGGAAAEAADTAAGQYKIFTNQMSELKETLGAALLPVIDQLLPVLNRMAEFAANNTDAIKILIAVIGGLSGAIVGINAVMKAYNAMMIVVQGATKAWTALQWLLNAALEANPIGLIIFALAALAAGLVIAYKNSETFRNIVNAAFGAVKIAMNELRGVAKTVFFWIKDHWTIAQFAFGPIVVALTQIITHFDKIKSAAEAAFGFIKSAAGAVESAIRAIVGAVEDLIGWIGRIHFPSKPGWLPFSIPSVGMAGFTAAPALAGMSSSLGVTPRAASSGVTINVYGALDPEGTARTIVRLLDQHNRRQGR